MKLSETQLVANNLLRFNFICLFTRHLLENNLLPSEKSTRQLLYTFIIFEGKFELFSRINFGARSNQNQIDGFNLDNVFNDLFAKSLYLFPQSI